MCAKGFALITKIQEKVKEKLRELTGGTASFDPIPENEPLNNYRSMVVSDLKELLEERDLSKAGRKNDLIERLEEYDKTKYQILNVSDLKELLEERELPRTGRKEELIKRLEQNDKDEFQKERIQRERCQLEPHLLQKIHQGERDLAEIKICHSDLVEYRSHLARHISEDAAAKEELNALQDDEAAFRVDYKMKILPAAYRESQKMWFGKKGTTMLGAMIIMNDKDGGEMKTVSFVMMGTDDSKQDYHAVACAKTFLYEKCLPSHIKKARFCSDGAGCFKSKHHRGFQPFWKHWTGIDEVSLQITPAGDGKTSLDGMFGRVNQLLKQAVANGHSYWHANLIGKALESTDGLPATTSMLIHLIHQLKWKLISQVWMILVAFLPQI